MLRSRVYAFVNVNLIKISFKIERESNDYNTIVISYYNNMLYADDEILSKFK